MKLPELYQSLLAKQQPTPSENTIKNYVADVRYFERWFSHNYGRLPFITDINKDLVDKFSQDIAVSPRTKERHISSLKKFITLLIDSGHDIQNPFPPTQQMDTATDDWRLREFKHYLYKQRSSNLTVKNYMSDINSFTRWLELEKHIQMIQSISNSVIDEYSHNLIHGLGLSPKSVNRKMSSIRKYLDFAEHKLEPVTVSIPETPKTTFNLIKSESKGKDISALEAFRVKETQYSRIAPVRLIQKAGKLYEVAEEKTAYGVSQILPSLPSKNLMSYKSVIGQVRHSRPAWYSKYHSISLTRYLHIGILTLFTSSLLVFGYAKYIDTQGQGEVLGNILPDRKVLSFSGKLAKENDSPITTPTEITFSIYPHRTDNTTVLWKETHEINPNDDGSFTVQLGRKELLENRFFSENQDLYLGMRIGSGVELLPRQRLANVGYAQDSEMLQGMTPLTANPAKPENAILALDSSGNLVFGGRANPVFQSSGGDFTVSGTTTILTTVEGSNGDIVLNPDGSGSIDLRGPIANKSTDASASGSVDFADEVVISSASAETLLTVNNTDPFGDIMKLMSQNITRMVVDHAGHVGIGTETPSQLVHIADMNNPTMLIENLLTRNRLDVSANESFASIGTYSYNALGLKTNNLVRFTISPDGNVGIGTSNPTAMLDVFGTASISGSLTFTGGVRNIQSANNNSLIIGGNTTGNLILQPLNGHGFVGIANNNPQYKLDILDNQATRSAMQIFNASSSQDADGLRIQLGNNTATVSASNSFISFHTQGVGLAGSITGDNASGVRYNTTAADFAEYLKKDPNEVIPYGSITCLSSSGTVKSCSSENKNIVGVTSRNPGFLGGKDLGDKSVIVGLLGQIETYVIAEREVIRAGDPITASSIPGIGTKANKTGMIIGRALESYDQTTPGKILVLVQPTWYEPNAILSANGDLIIKQVPDINLDTSTYEKVAKALQESTARVKNDNGWISEARAFASVVVGRAKIGLLETQNAIVSGTLAAEKVVVNQLHVATDNMWINGKPLSEYIAELLPSNDFSQNIASAESINTNFISPLSEDSDIAISLESSTFEIRNSQSASSEAVASIDNEGNAHFDGSISAREATFENSVTANTGLFQDATISGTLSAGSIRANDIDGLDEKVASYTESYISNQNQLSPSLVTSNWSVDPGEFISVATMSANFALFHENLLSLGTTTLREATVMDRFSIGTNFVFESDSVDVLGSDLQIQPLGQGGVSFLSGLVAIDQQGNLAVGGDATFAQNVTIQGGLFANIISPLADSDFDIYLPERNSTESANFRIVNASKTPVLTINGDGDVYSSGSANFVGDLVASGSAFLSKLNIFSQDAQAVSENEVVANSSAGTAVLKAYKREVTIHTPFVNADSLIYITPSTNTGNQVLYLLRQSEDGSFTVGVNQATSRDIQFNWFVVN